jgi:WD40 repeat protein
VARTLLWLWNNGKKIAEVDAPPAVIAASVYPDGQFIFMGLTNGDVIVSDWSGKFKTVFNVPGLTALTLSNNGRYVAVGNSDGIASVWEIAQKKTERRSQFALHAGPINCLRFENDNKTVLSGSTDQLLYRWDAVTGQELQCCEGHDSEVTCVAPANGPAAATASGSGDMTVKLWNLDLGIEIATTPQIANGVGGLDVLCRAGDLVIGTGSGRLLWWNMVAQQVINEIQLANSTIRHVKAVEDETVVLVAGGNGNIFAFQAQEPWSQLFGCKAPGTILALDVFYRSKPPKLPKSPG